MAPKHIQNGWLRRTGIDVLGWTLVVLGIAALVLPGPGLLMIVGGLAVLSQQYHWAHRYLAPLKAYAYHGAAIGVKTIPRIAASCSSGLTIMGLGVVWLIQPPAPQWWPLAPDWWLLGGPAAGVSLIISALIALILILYSVRRFRGKPLPGLPRKGEDFGPQHKDAP